LIEKIDPKNQKTEYIYDLRLRFVNTRIREAAHHAGPCGDLKKWPCAYEIES
jgi:hypothetical protein